MPSTKNKKAPRFWIIAGPNGAGKSTIVKTHQFSLRRLIHDVRFINPDELAEQKLIKRGVIIRDPGILGGAPVFAGTRVPVRNLLDCLEGGYTIDQFLEDFPTVRRDQVIALLEETLDRSRSGQVARVTR